MFEAVLATQLVIIAGLGLLALQLHECAKALWVEAQAMNALADTMTLIAERAGAVEQAQCEPGEVKWPTN